MAGRTITLKFTARCADCGATLEPGTVARWYGRGRVYGRACHERTERRTSERPTREEGYDDGGGPRFADPGGKSALRAASRSNPRNLPCPNCGAANRLTPADRAQGYQCNACADVAEGLGF